MADTITRELIEFWRGWALKNVDQKEPRFYHEISSANLLTICDAALRGLSQWRSIESAPKDGRPFLANSVGMPPGDAEVIYVGPDGDWYDWKTERCIGPFTHYMPLPAPPGQEPKSEGEPGYDRLIEAARQAAQPIDLKADAYQRGFEDCREKAVEAAEAVSEKYMTASQKARDEEDYDLFEYLESKAVAVGLVIEAIIALTPNTESEVMPHTETGLHAATPSQDNPQSTEPVGADDYKIVPKQRRTIHASVTKVAKRPPQPADPIADEDGMDKLQRLGQEFDAAEPIGDEGGDDYRRKSLIEKVNTIRTKPGVNGYSRHIASEVVRLLTDDADLIERLEKERDAWRSECRGLSKIVQEQDDVTEERDQLQAERDVLTQKVNALRTEVDYWSEREGQLRASNDKLRAALERVDAKLPNFPDPEAVPEDDIAEIAITLRDWHAIKDALAETGGA